MSLDGMTIILTRSDEQLAAKLGSEGATVKTFPVFCFKSTLSVPRTDCGSADLVIFSSPQAVLYGYSRLNLDSESRLAVPGQGTARQLRSLTSHRVITPRQGAGLQALLSAPELQGIDDWSVLLVCGEAGSRRSMALLKAYARSVRRLPVYSRGCSPMDGTIMSWFKPAKADAIMVSSVGAVTCLANGLGELFRIQSWLVSSRRVARPIRARGGKVVAIAKSAEAEAMVAAARDLWTKGGASERRE